MDNPVKITAAEKKHLNYDSWIRKIKCSNGTVRYKYSIYMRFRPAVLNKKRPKIDL
jgi:hypothetical protein